MKNPEWNGKFRRLPERQRLVLVALLGAVIGLATIS